MTTTTNPDPTGSQGSATGQAGAAGVQGTAGSAAGSAGYATQGFEGSLKQATDINTEEALAVLQAQNPAAAQFFQNLMSANAKRTYDLHQSLDLAAQVGDSTSRLRINSLAEQAIQNAIETANMVSKQAVRHADIAIDRQWNTDEQGYQVAAILRSDVFKDAISGAVAAAVAATVNAKVK